MFLESAREQPMRWCSEKYLTKRSHIFPFLMSRCASSEVSTLRVDRLHKQK